MKFPHPVLLLLLGLGAGSVRAAESPPAAAPDPMAQMTTYYVGFLTHGPNAGTGTKEEREKIQAAHMANIERLHTAGKLLVAGPFLDNGTLRGIFIFKCASLEEAQALAATDPAVQAGRFIVEIHPWLTMKGNIRDPEFPIPPTRITP